MLDQFTEKIFKYLVPLKKNPFFQGQPPCLDEILPYEDFFKDAGRTVFCVSDFNYGIIWEIFPLPHEMATTSEIEKKLASLQEVLNELQNDQLTFQFIYSSEPSDEDIVIPESVAESFPEKIAVKRKIHLKSLCSSLPDSLMKRKIYLTMCLEGSSRDNALSIEHAVHDQSDTFQKDIYALREKADTVESLLNKSFYFKNTDPSSLLNFLRSLFHSKDVNKDLTPVQFPDSGNFKNKIMRDFCEFNPDSIGVGQDTWEVLSWAGQPEGEVSKAAMVRLLSIKTPLIAVINLRGSNAHGIDEKVKKTRTEGDPKKEKQNEELKAVQKALVRNIELAAISVHVLVRNVNIHHSEKYRLTGQKTSKILKKELKIDFLVERFAARAVFLSCLPLCFNGEISGFVRRSKRVLASTVPAYLPIYGGMKASPYEFQLMLNRAFELISLDPAYSRTNPHLAILGGSGTGKSFYLVCLIMAAYAKNPEFTVFCIDNIASYKYLGEALGEDVGFNFSEPPGDFPNLFKGEFDPKRLPVITGILCTSVSIICGETVSPNEQTLLSNAIKVTYERNKEISGQKYVKSDGEELGHWVDTDGRVRIPRLSDIIDMFPTIVRDKGIDSSVATNLSNKLAPFIGSGPYANIFDRQEYQDKGNKVAGFNLYDLHQITDGKLKSITSLLIIADVYRMMGILNSSDSEGEIEKIKAYLIFEEVGVNLQANNKELSELVENLVPTLRKRGILCIGIGNATTQYSKEFPAARTIWKIAKNKLIFGLDEDKEDVLKSGLLKDLELDVAASLDKIIGHYSEGLWINYKTTYGSFRYYPTGYEYWLAANESGDVIPLEKSKSIHGTYQKAIMCLGSLFPSGFRDEFSNHRQMTESELEEIKNWQGDD